jgi:hypothetical protein
VRSLGRSERTYNGEGEGETLRELDAAHDGEREQAVDAGHEPHGAED